MSDDSIQEPYFFIALGGSKLDKQLWTNDPTHVKSRIDLPNLVLENCTDHNISFREIHARDRKCYQLIIGGLDTGMFCYNSSNSIPYNHRWVITEYKYPNRDISLLVYITSLRTEQDQWTVEHHRYELQAGIVIWKAFIC